MSKLNFSNLSEAYSIPSTRIKETSNEISKLKKIVENSVLPTIPPVQGTQPGYQRIGPADTTEATFSSKPSPRDSEDLEYTFLKLIKNPEFKDIIKNYITFKHPDWLLAGTNYQKHRPFTKESFGNKYSSNSIDDEIKNYIMFFTISIVIYLMLSLYSRKA